MKTILPLVLVLAFFCGAQMAHADFKIKNGSVHSIKVQPRGKSTQTVKGNESVLVYTSNNEVKITGPFGLDTTTKVPSNKTVLVERRFGNWSIKFQ